jgi:signal transduction histidine kinase/FixJ family two-component response regulator
MKLRSKLVFLVLGTLVPILVFSGVMLIEFNRHTRAATEKGLVETARALSVAVDQQIMASISVLKVLASSEELRRGDLRQFDRVVRAALVTQPYFRNIVLFTSDGRQLVNTALAFGAPLPSTGNPAVIATVTRTRAPTVSDLFIGRVLNQPLVLVTVPVVHGDRLVYVLGGSYSTSALTNLLLQQKVPPNAIGTLLDRNKVIIARTRAAERFVGQRGTQDLAAKMDETAEGAFRLFTKEGQGVYAAISRSPETGWTVALGVPQAAADGLLRGSLWLLLLVGVGSVSLGITLAASGARRIARPMAALAATAAAFVKGETVEFRRSAIAEVNEVARAMEIAGHERQQRETAAAALAEVGRELVSTLDPAQVVNRIVCAVAEVFRVRRTVLYEVEGSAQELVCVAAAGDAGSEEWLGRRLAREDGVAGRARAEETNVPLRARQQILGILSLGHDADRVFTDKELRLLSAFADQAAIAIENARLHSDLRERLLQSETLLAVSEQVSGTLDVTEMMRLVARQAGRALGADMVGIFMADPSHDSLHPIAGYHVPKHLLADFMTLALPLKGHRVLEEAWEQRRVVALSDVTADSRVDQELLRRYPQRSILFCPMIVQGEPIGGLCLTWFKDQHNFAPSELQLVEGISRQAGIALANGRLVEELKRRQARLEALVKIDRQLSRIQPVESLLERIAEACGRLFDASSVSFSLVETGHLVIHGNWGPGDMALTRDTLKVGEGLAGLVAASGEVLVVRDPITDPRLKPSHRDAYRRLGIHAFLGVPVKPGDRVIGVLAIRSPREEGFSEADVDLAKAFASQAAVALENSRLYQETQRAFDELSRTQEQLAQAQKMEAIGLLAGGIAHDFNNLLTVIQGRSYLLLQRVPAQSPARRDIELIQETSERAAALTRQLLAFGRRQMLLPRPLDLDALIDELAPMLARLIGEHIELLIVPGGRLWRVMADPGQVEQVVMNLLVNSRDAMPDGGTIRIETSNEDLHEIPSRIQRLVPPGQYVRLVVHDSGCGMDAATLTRIFEPFYTTKPSGQGTGLGLSIAYGIVHQSGGFIGVDSAIGRGTTFTIHLPRTLAPVVSPETQTDGGRLTKGKETVLLVEDEDEVRDLACDVLKSCGYTVLATGDPSEALVIGERHQDKIDLLITDVVMPVMQGPALAQRLLARDTGLRVLYMSGYTDGLFASGGAMEPSRAFLQKPFTAGALARAVREALDGVPATDSAARSRADGIDPEDARAHLLIG